MKCPYCGLAAGSVEERWESDPHGNPMCEMCSEIVEVQWKMCYPCNEYGLALRQSGVWICVDCGDTPESLDEQRVVESGGHGMPGQDGY